MLMPCKGEVEQISTHNKISFWFICIDWWIWNLCKKSSNSSHFTPKDFFCIEIPHFIIYTIIKLNWRMLNVYYSWTSEQKSSNFQEMLVIYCSFEKQNLYFKVVEDWQNIEKIYIFETDTSPYFLLWKSSLYLHVISKTRPDTRLPQSRAGGQEQCWRRSLKHLGRSSRLKKLKNAEKVKKGPTDQPTNRWTYIAECRVA